MFGFKPAATPHALGERDLKDLARRLQHLLPLPDTDPDTPLSLTLDECQEVIARLYHHASWSEVQQKARKAGFTADPTAPALLKAKTLSLFDKTLGLLPLGNERHHHGRRPKAAWAQSAAQALEQTLVMGSTGAGKTETLLSMIAASIAHQGVIYMDGKGDGSLFAKMFSLTQAAGRLGDLLVLNFMNGWDRPSPGQRLSNTFNPLEKDDAQALLAWCQTWLTEGLVRPAGANPKAWDPQILGLLHAVLTVLVWGRNERLWALDLNRLGQALEFDGLIGLLHDTRLPEAVRAPLRRFLETHLADGSGQPVWDHLDQARVRHATQGAQLARRCLGMAQAYGYIFDAQVDPHSGEWLGAEIDMDEVLSGRKILLVLLPALEKSVDELALLGQSVVGALHAAIARAAGPRVPDAVSTTLVMDEAGYYMPPNVEEMAHQAPLAGVACIWGTQDLPAFTMKLAQQAVSLAEGCGTKLFMKMEDPSETFQLYQRSTFRTGVIPGQEHQALLDVKDQGPGEAFVVSNGHSIPLRMVYHPIQRPDRTWLNRPPLRPLGPVLDRPATSATTT